MTLYPLRFSMDINQDLPRRKIIRHFRITIMIIIAWIVELILHIILVQILREECNKILQSYPPYTYRDSYEINTNFTFIPFWIYITAGELSVHKWRWDNSYEKKLFDQRELPTGLGFSCVLQWSARDSSPLASVLTIKASLSALI